MSLESVFKLSLIMNMIDNLSGPMAGVASRVGANVSKLDALSNTFGGMAKAGAAMTEAGTQITSAVLAPVGATFETKRALGELASLGVKDLDTLETAARSFSDQWSGTTKADFISAAYDIKSGISSLSDEGVAEMTALAALTAKATKSTAGEMTSLFATGYGIYKSYYDDLSDLEFGQMFSAGISESVRAFKTSGSGMAQSIQSLGAAATTAQVPLEEQLAVLGMLQGTMSGSEAGTKYKAFLQTAAKGGEALGLSFLDANNQLLSMPEILDQLRGKFGETMDAAEKMELKQAFGSDEAVALIDLMYSKTGDLQDNILNLYDAMGQGTGVAQEMASAIQETEPERFERLQQRIHNVAESIGGSLLPTINDLMSKGENVLTKVGSWIEQNQELVRVIMLIVLAIGGFLAVGGTLITVISGVGLVITKAVSTFKMLKAGFLLVKGALTPLIGSVWSFTAALLANPVTWIVIGIVALIAALVLLYNKCEWFRNAVNSILNFFKEKLGAALQVAKNIFQGIGNVIGSVMSAAKATVSEKLNNIKNAYQSHGGGIRGVAAAAMEGVKGIYTAGYTFLDKLTGGKLTALKDKAAEKFGQLREKAGEAMQGVKDAFVNGYNTADKLTGGALSAMKDTVTEKLGNIKAAYEAHGGGIKGVAAAAMEGVKGYFTAGYTFPDNWTGGKLSAIKDTVTGKLGEMKAAYDAHGGGIQGAAAAAMTGVQGIFSGGYAALDSLTGGRLSAIREKFTSTVSSIAQGVSERFAAVREAFSNGINTIKNAVTGAVNWFFTSGQRIVSTFADGIRGAFSKAVDAVKGGLQKIRNLLPFSDAKEGPLSSLTLSGQRTMTTLAQGMTLAKNAPAEAMSEGMTKAKTTLEQEAPKKINLNGDAQGEGGDSSDSTEDGSSGKKVIIQKLLLQVDLKKIKDLQMLLKLLQEVEDYTNGNGTEGADDDPDAVPTPA